MIVYRNFLVVAHSKGDDLPDHSERLSILHVTRVEGDGVEVV